MSLFEPIFAALENGAVRYVVVGGMATVLDEKSTDWGSWAANDEQKLTMGLRATPAQRLAWLEEMIAVAYRSGALPRRR